jgi:predicted permease
MQVALCLMLVAASGLLLRTLYNVEHIGLGIRTPGLVVFGINPQQLAHTDAEVTQLYQALLERLRTTPGIESASLMQNRIGSGWSNNTTAIVDGRTAAGSFNDYSHMRWNVIGPDLFSTLGVPLLNGREFNDRDSDTSPKVAIVNETFAKRFFGGHALGHQVSFTPRLQFTVVGVVAKSKYSGVREDDLAMAYFPYTQVCNIGLMHLEVRTAGDPNRFLPAIRKAVAGYSPDLALLQPMTQQAQFDVTISDEKLIARLAICFGALALLLVVTGLYGTLAYNVSRRTSEIGIRMALGARRLDVLWMVLRESLVVYAIGLAAGLPLTIASARLLRSLLFGLAPSDPLTLGLAVAGLIAVGLAASLLPARRAASIEPTRALRYE